MRILFVIAALFLLPACAIIGPGDGGTVGDDPTSESEARIRWQRLGMSDYDMTLGRWCFCISAGEFRVSVRNDEVVLIRNIETDEVLPIDQYEWFPTINELFDLISDLPATADTYEVEFDPSGYPASISIDYITQAVDDELGYTVRDVERVDSDDLYRLGLDQTVQIGPVSIGFHRLESDSRCPSNVVCIWEGQAVVELSVNPGAGPEYLARLVNGGRLEGDMDRVAVGGLDVHLLAVWPYPVDGDHPPTADAYEVLLRIGPAE